MLTQSSPPRPARAVPALVLALALGCSSTPPPENQQPPPPEVPVSRPVVRDVVDHAEFAARTAAVEAVKVRARVWGHLGKFQFAEGAEVKKGDLLFQIDRKPYQAAMNRAEAEQERTAARLARLVSD